MFSFNASSAHLNIAYKAIMHEISFVGEVCQLHVK